jgi:hypothetical protein
MTAGRGISTGPNSRPLDETIAETGPGIPDDAVGDGELDPGDIGADAERQADALKRRGWDRDQKRSG